MTDQLEGQMHIYDLDIWSGKTCQEHLAVTVEKTSKPSSKRSSKSSNPTAPICLMLSRNSGGANGQNQDASMMNWVDGPLLGEYMTHSFGEQPNTLMAECGFPALPNGVSASRLSQILQEEAHQRYYLSARACNGIINRAAKRGKELPELLRQALENQAKQDDNGSDLP